MQTSKSSLITQSPLVKEPNHGVAQVSCNRSAKICLGNKLLSRCFLTLFVSSSLNDNERARFMPLYADLCEGLI